MLRITSVQFLPHTILKICFNDGTVFLIQGALKEGRVCGIARVRITRGSKLFAEHLGQQGGPTQVVNVDVDELSGLLPHLELAMQYVPTTFTLPEGCNENGKEAAIALANLFHIHSKAGINKLKKRLEETEANERKPDTS